MDVIKRFVLLSVLYALATSSARQLPQNLEAMKYPDQERGSDTMCTLCEEYSTRAVDYLAKNKTQKEIIALLHLSCLQLPTFKTGCILLVDHYFPRFFTSISSIQPDAFCEKFKLCKQLPIVYTQSPKDGCELCQNAMSELLDKLKDPDAQLDVIELLLKACNSMDKYAKKCKKLVFEYGPLILDNMEQFLESTDVCSAIHACKESAVSAEEAMPIAVATTVLSDS